MELTTYIFLVGPEEQPFEFQASLITSNRDLVSVLSTFRSRRSRARSKRTGKETIRRYYYLPSLVPYEFEQFELFLLGGDFLWNEKIATLFSVMGFRNVHGYPLDYWKIKLQDNWIRDNFYSLRLYDPRTIDPPLILERGPYVGLVKMNDYFKTGIPISFEQERNLHFLRNLGEEGHLPLGEDRVIIAGGALLTYLMGAPRKPSDIDIFFTTQDKKRAEASILETINNYLAIENLLINGITDIARGHQAFHEAGNLLEILDEIRREIQPNPALLELQPYPTREANMRIAEMIRDFDIDAGVHTRLSNTIVTENAITLQGKVKLQFILRLYTCPSEVVHGFDLDASGLLFDGQDLWATKRAEYAIKTKVNYFDFTRVSPSYAYRLAKYASRGFKVWIPGFHTEKVNRKVLERIQEEFLEDSKSLEEINRRVFPPSLLVKSAPYYIPTRGDNLILGTTSIVEEIMENRNPIDLIIFATYFHYLPSMKISDYEEGSTPINVDEIVRDATYGPGYVILHTNFEERVFNLPAEMVEGSGLPREPEWKEQNPMEQLTGTFTPTRVEDIREWFRDSTLYLP